MSDERAARAAGTMRFLASLPLTSSGTARVVRHLRGHRDEHPAAPPAADEPDAAQHQPIRITGPSAFEFVPQFMWAGLSRGFEMLAAIKRDKGFGAAAFTVLAFTFAASAVVAYTPAVVSIAILGGIGTSLAVSGWREAKRRVPETAEKVLPGSVNSSEVEVPERAYELESPGVPTPGTPEAGDSPAAELPGDIAEPAEPPAAGDAPDAGDLAGGDAAAAPETVTPAPATDPAGREAARRRHIGDAVRKNFWEKRSPAEAATYRDALEAIATARTRADAAAAAEAALAAFNEGGVRSRENRDYRWALGEIVDLAGARNTLPQIRRYAGDMLHIYTDELSVATTKAAPTPEQSLDIADRAREVHAREVHGREPAHIDLVASAQRRTRAAVRDLGSAADVAGVPAPVAPRFPVNVTAPGASAPDMPAGPRAAGAGPSVLL